MTTHITNDAAKQFSSLSLHDAVLYEVHLEWSAATCAFDVDAFLDLRQPAIPHRLIFRGVTHTQIPHEAPWGESTHINSTRVESSGLFIIEMQSGDEIRVTAAAFEFAPRKA